MNGYVPPENNGITVDVEGDAGPAQLVDAIMEQRERVIEARAAFDAQDFSDLTPEAIARMRAENNAEIVKDLNPFWGAIRTAIDGQVDASQRAVNAARFPLRSGDANAKTRASVEYQIGMGQGQVANLRDCTNALEMAIREGAIDRASAIVATAKTVQRQNVTPDAQVKWGRAVADYETRTGVSEAQSRLDLAEQSRKALRDAEVMICNSGSGDPQTLMVLGLLRKQAAEHPYFRHEHTPHVGISKQRTR
jgi:hypothetical protein